MHRFAPLFEAVGAAILTNQNGAARRHADEIGWRVTALRDGGGSGYAWLWTSVGCGAVYFHVGYKTLVGAQMRYAVHDRNGWPLGILGFSTAAWALAPRDRFIGWTATPPSRYGKPTKGRLAMPPRQALEAHPQPVSPVPPTNLPRQHTATAWPNSYVRLVTVRSARGR